MEIREEYRIVLEVCPTPLMLASRGGDILVCNGRFARLFGYEKNELHNQTLEILVPEKARKFHPELRQAFFKAPTSRNMGTGRDLYGVRKDGEMIPVEIGLSPLHGAADNLIMVTVIDITERKENEKYIRQKNEELQRLNHELTEFVYSASHDLKAPLSSIFGLLELTETDISNGDLEEVRTNLSRARILAQSLSGRIEDMLALAKADHLDDVMEDISIPDLVHKACQAVQGQSGPTSCLTTAFAHSDPIRSVPARLSAILENLIANAYKYSDPDKPENRIHIETWDEDDVLKLAIEDNGIGIPEDHIGKIFKLFKRVANSSQPGSGIGLALVEKNLIHLRGSIEVVSSQEGSCFTISLPHNREVAALV